MARVLKIKELDPERLKFDPELMYGDWEKKVKFFLNTGYVTCPYGLQEDHLYLDAGQPATYARLLRSTTPVDYIKVWYTAETVQYYDTTGQRRSPDPEWYTLSMPFQACFLLEPVCHGGKTVLYLKQIRLKRVVDLPAGSVLTYDPV